MMVIISNNDHKFSNYVILSHDGRKQSNNAHSIKTLFTIKISYFFY